MRLYLMRHGEAGSASHDDLRELTPKGAQDSQQVLQKAVLKIKAPVTSLVSSDLVRAQQTAAIAADLLKIDSNIGAASVLRPESSPQAIVEFLDTLVGENSAEHAVMLVGHQPVLGSLLTWLTDEDSFRYAPGTSSFFALDLLCPARGCAQVVWEVHT